MWGFTSFAAGLQHTHSNSGHVHKSDSHQFDAPQGAPESHIAWRAAEPTVAPKQTDFTGHVLTSQRAAWGELNEVLHPYLLKDSFVTQSPEIVQVLSVTAEQPWVKTICETGFSAGHSAMLFLLANPNATVYSFGMGNQPYTATAERFLHSKFGDRFRFTKGNSTKTLPSFRQANPSVRCDLMLVDGGYDELSASTDLQNFRQMANPVSQVVFMMDSPCAASWCIGRGAAFSQAVEEKEIVPVSRLPINTWHGLSSAWFTPVAPLQSLPAGHSSNFPTTVSPHFLAAHNARSL